MRSEEFLIPKYILSTSMFSYKNLVTQLDTPFVAKGLESSMGREVMLIQNERDYSLLSKEYTIDKEWLFEEFISQSYEKI